MGHERKVATITELDLMKLQAAALYTHDLAGHIVAINEPSGGLAPRFFLGRTPIGNIWRVRHDLSESLIRRLDALAGSEPVSGGLEPEPEQLAGYLAALGEDSSVTATWSGPAYHFPDALPPPSHAVTQITRENFDLLRHLDWTEDELAEHFDRWAPMYAIREGEIAVSICFSSRLTSHAAEAGVHTLEGWRGRGYAASLVVAWARAIRATGRTPLYSTSWENQASRAVARKLGLVMYGSDFSLR